MLKSRGTWIAASPLLRFSPILSPNNKNHSSANAVKAISFSNLMTTLNFGDSQVSFTKCKARRRVVADREDNEEEENEENVELKMLERYSECVRDEVLLVTAMMDEEEVEVVIFKGFSSCLSYGTSPDPSKSVLPKRASIKSIDRVKGPFDPSNIEYLQRGITLEDIKNRVSFNY